jgi:hypothetical protein
MIRATPVKRKMQLWKALHFGGALVILVLNPSLVLGLLIVYRPILHRGDMVD